MRTYSLTINGKDYQAAALPLGPLRDFTRDGTLERLTDAASGDPTKLIGAFEAIIRIISAALKPRYPECDEAWVAANVPAGQQGRDLLTAIMRESGLIGEGDGGPNMESPKDV